jgi:hypothetical protein
MGIMLLVSFKYWVHLPIKQVNFINCKKVSTSNTKNRIKTIWKGKYEVRITQNKGKESENSYQKLG